MDEYFEVFLEQFGPAIGRRDVPVARLERFRGKLPDSMLGYWREHGWCGYADGLFWTVDPDEYEPALQAWLGNTSFMQADAYHVIGRTAFGHLLFWGERTGPSLQLFAPGAYAVPMQAASGKMELEGRMFFSTQDRKPYDFGDLFAPALKKLGPLKHDEMYGFVPALALGGPATLDHLQKVQAVEHLVLLAQLSELRVLNALPR
jgi:hypothetical protein